MKGGEKKMQTFANDQLRLVQAIRAEQMSRRRSSRRFEKPAPNIGVPSARGSSGSAPAWRVSHVRPGPIAMSGRAGAPTRRPPMLTLNHELRASYAFIERNFFLTRRYWGWELAFLVYSVAGALSISLIGADQGSPRLILLLMVGAIFWNYLSVVFSLDRGDDRRRALGRHARVHDDGADRRWTQLLGSVSYAMVYGLVHTAVSSSCSCCFFPQLDVHGANPYDRDLVHGPGLVQLRWGSDDRGHPAAPLRGARGADDVRPPVVPAARQRRVLLDRRPARLDAGLSRISPATYVLDGVRKGLSMARR